MDFTLTERTEPFTLEEVFDFIDDTSISKLDAHELKSRIVDVVQDTRNKAIDELCKEISKLLSGDTKHLEGKAYYKELAYLEVLKIAEQMKGE